MILSLRGRVGRGHHPRRGTRAGPDRGPVLRAAHAAAAGDRVGQRGLARRRALGLPLPAPRGGRRGRSSSSSRCSGRSRRSCRSRSRSRSYVGVGPAGWPFFGAELVPGDELRRPRRGRARRAGAAAGRVPARAARRVAGRRRCPRSGWRWRRWWRSRGGASRPRSWAAPPVVFELLDAAAELPPLAPSVVCHGDLHFRHLLVRDGALTGVIDWGDLCRGDPAVDLMAYWMALPGFARPDFLRAYGHPVREDQLLRARVWALVCGAGLLEYALDVGDERLAREAARFARTGGMLIAPEALAERLDEFRVFDATVALDRPPEAGRTWRDRGARTTSPGTSRARCSPTWCATSPTPTRRSRSPCRAPSASLPSPGAHGIGPGVSVVIVFADVGDVGDAAVVAAALLRVRRRRRARRWADGLEGGGPAGLRAGEASYPRRRSRRIRGRRCWPRGRTSRRSWAASPPAWSTRSTRASSAARARRPTAAPAGSRAASTSPPPGRSTRRRSGCSPSSLPPGPLVFYCGGGISATVGVFAAALAGRDDARLYDGSLTEWTADPALPVEVG